MTDLNIINGRKMSPEEMRTFLQLQLGVPVAIRSAESPDVTCPYCSEKHFHDPSELGYARAQCAEIFKDSVISINDREFVPNYGYILFEYKLKDGTTYQLVSPQDNKLDGCDM